MLITENAQIERFLSKKDLDIRKSHYGRWFDQKCTPDVVSIVADCVLHFVNKLQLPVSFSSKDIWHLPYSNSVVASIFGKPNLSDFDAKSEYDKFFEQPLNMLAYSGVLSLKKDKGKNVYSLGGEEEKSILYFLSIGEVNSIIFICQYLRKTLKDSGEYEDFDNFFKSPSNETYDFLKVSFRTFLKINTSIENTKECNRIFTKVVNPLAFKASTEGSEGGKMSRDHISYDKLMYNRTNFRDQKKPKGRPRKSFSASGSGKSERYSDYLLNKVKDLVGTFNATYNLNKTEIQPPEKGEEYFDATQRHHIFPRKDFPELAAYPENIICLTPNEHALFAHPNNDTKKIDPRYQETCLLSKMIVIKKSVKDLLGLYSFDRFKDLLKQGFKESRFDLIQPNDFDSLEKLIKEQYR